MLRCPARAESATLAAGPGEQINRRELPISNYEFCILNYALIFPSLRHSFERLLLAPAAGYRHRDGGALANVGTHCCCWASSVYASDDVAAATLFTHAVELVLLGNGDRAFSRSVRCVQASAGVAFPSGPRSVWAAVRIEYAACGGGARQCPFSALALLKYGIRIANKFAFSYLWMQKTSFASKTVI